VGFRVAHQARPWRDGLQRGKGAEKDFWSGRSRQPIDKAHFGQARPRKSRHFLGKIWLELGLAWIGFDKFGIGLVIVIQRRSDKEVHAAVAQERRG
jgi:hypothetical protein